MTREDFFRLAKQSPLFVSPSPAHRLVPGRWNLNDHGTWGDFVLAAFVAEDDEDDGYYGLSVAEATIEWLYSTGQICIDYRDRDARWVGAMAAGGLGLTTPDEYAMYAEAFWRMGQ